MSVASVFLIRHPQRRKTSFQTSSICFFYFLCLPDSFIPRPLLSSPIPPSLSNISLLTSPLSTHPSIFLYLCVMQDDLFKPPPTKKNDIRWGGKKTTSREEFVLNLDDTSCHPAVLFKEGWIRPDTRFISLPHR